MKRLLLLLSVLLPAIAFAENVNIQRAVSAAQNFFKGTKAGSVELVWTGHGSGMQLASTESGAPFYVFNNAAGGFVVISGDDAIQPVLAYSHTGSFKVEGMPENISGWFTDIEKLVKYVRRNKIVQPDASRKWRDFESGLVPQATVLKKYDTALWGQGDPFDGSCPLYNGERCAVGCVAAATAIIMRYFEHPQKGSGTLPGYVTEKNKITIPELKLGTTYQWDQMPLTNGKTGWTSAQKKAVSELMYHLGVMVKMDYDVDASAAAESLIPMGLSTYFGYDAGGMCLFADIFTTDEWLKMIKNELEHSGPLLYAASDPDEGGHAFVVHGYDSDGLFAINWGWYGSDNGFYSLPDIHSSTYKFTEAHSAFFGVKPDKGGKAEPFVYSERCYETDKGLTVSNIKPSVGETFDISFSGAVWNIGSAPFDGKVSICHADKNFKFKEQLTSEESYEGDDAIDPWYGSPIDKKYKNCKITGKIEEGDVIKLFYKLSSTKEWVSMPYNVKEKDFPDVVKLEVEKDPETPIDESTSVFYDKATGLVTVKTLSGMKSTLKNKTGQEMSSAMKVKDGVITIDAAKLKGMDCVLTLYKGSKSYSITLKF